MIKSLALAALSVAVLTGAALAEGDAVKGEKVFKKCKACHTVGDGKIRPTGPLLNNVFGRTAGTFEGYAKSSGATKYSKAMVAAGEGGLVWTPEVVAEYLVKPKDFILDLTGDKTNMAFSGLKKPADIENLVAYLLTFSPDYVPAE